MAEVTARMGSTWAANQSAVQGWSRGSTRRMAGQFSLEREEGTVQPSCAPSYS